MSLISKVFPPIDDALLLEPEELAVPLIECLCRLEDDRDSQRSHLSRKGTFTPIRGQRTKVSARASSGDRGASVPRRPVGRADDAWTHRCCQDADT